MNPTHFVAMLAELTSAPRFLDPLCKGSTLWDAPVPTKTAANEERIERAKRLCLGCKALDACRNYLRSMPKGAVTGIIAAEYYPSRW
jgi:hypothetical protein